MSETKIVPGKELGAEQVSEVAGGTLCSPEELDKIISGLKDNYERLIDLTSYVIDRVAGGPYTGP
jgi:hypothetical protein